MASTAGGIWPRCPKPDLVLIAIVGTGGRAALARSRRARTSRWRAQEILVMAGEAVMTRRAAKGVKVLPVDSEHNATSSARRARFPRDVRRLSSRRAAGRPANGRWRASAGVTPEQALKHPTWNMGAKITVDSATLFNKGLE